MGSDGKVWVVGSLNADLVQTVERLPVLGETVCGGDLCTYPGGKGANQAYAAGAQGATTVMVGNVGDDQFGGLLLESLQMVGVDISRVARVNSATGTASIFITPDGNSSIVISPGANNLLTPDDVRARLEGVGEGDFVLCQLENPVETVMEALKTAKAAGATTILDPAPSSGFRDEFLPYVDYITPNESEVSVILAGDVSLSGDLLPLEACIAAFRDRGASGVILKLGSEGCYCDDGSVTERVSAPVVKAVDTTGAGDTFNGAFAARMLESGSVKKSLEWANVAGALCVTRAGAQSSIPGHEEVGVFSAQSVA